MEFILVFLMKEKSNLYRKVIIVKTQNSGFK
jgi:hypothetical protein